MLYLLLLELLPFVISPLPACRGTLSFLAVSLSVRPSVCLSVSLSVRHTSVFRTFLSHALSDINESWHMLLVWIVTDQVRLWFRSTKFSRSSVRPSHFSFPDFSSSCFVRFQWKLACTFSMNSYRSSSTLVPVDQVFQELCPFQICWGR